jgi:hypothetical protein
MFFATILLLHVTFVFLLSNFAYHTKTVLLILKKNKLNIFYSWLLLLCFIAGQYVVYAHQHKINAGSGHQTHSPVKNQSAQTVQEKCGLCDAMHHVNAVLDSAVSFNPNIVTNHFYQVYNYDFISIALVLSAGRAPPVIVVC